MDLKVFEHDLARVANGDVVEIVSERRPYNAFDDKVKHTEAELDEVCP